MFGTAMKKMSNYRKGFIMGNFNAAFIEKYGEDGLNREEVNKLLDMLPDGAKVYPLEMFAREAESSAMGFITPDAADRLDYDTSQHSGFGKFVSGILDDMDKESPDHTYEYKGIRFWLSR